MRSYLTLSTAAAVAAFSLAACNKPAPEAPEAQPVNAAQDAVGAAVGQASATTLGANDTDAFVSNASQSDMYEIEAGKIAQSRSKTDAVKSFAAMMVSDHTAMSNEMKSLIAAAQKTPAASLDERRQGLIDNLKAATDANFDRTYLDQQAAAHEEALTLMRGYADNGGDAGLKGGAAKAVPKIRTHLEKVKSLQTAVK
ncbi:MAG: DUF4142 domain-containing protein [Phenylobacterium sp.]|uniref:DUF4142 domain-containing protein n=1 Tax=Phenylobacterium sp. TaxID=1871053 RepID=UPI002732BD0E|nr:DUF4142 domain-containing protein [Phenylobacterium sp.]MDP3175883.1 DUF4142 domain-containing protein [Phenylobacterium sp.]